jgi:hypothetical protein
LRTLTPSCSGAARQPASFLPAGCAHDCQGCLQAGKTAGWGAGWRLCNRWRRAPQGVWRRAAVHCQPALRELAGG